VAGLTRTSAGGFAFGGGAPPVGPFGGAPPPNGFIGPGRGTPGGGLGRLPVRGGGGFGSRGGGFGTETSADVSRALAYVASHGAAKRFGLIVTSEQGAAPYLIRGAPIAALGGFTGVRRC
jgi:hypothetical protein